MASNGGNALATGDTGSVFKLLNSSARPRELTGAVDLITHYGLREHYETYTKKSFPASIAESKYLRDVVGDMEIRKGEGMELGQLLRPNSNAADAFPAEIRPFDLEYLRRAFTLRESGPISLPEADRGLPTIGKTKDEERKKHKKHKHKDKHKSKDKDKEKDKEKRKEKHKEKDKDQAAKGENGEDKKKHKKKKRRHEGDEEEGDGHKHKKKKHKSSPNPDAAAATAAAAVKAR